MDMARILLTASSSSVPRVIRAARALAKRGHEVSVLEWDRESDLPKEEVRDGITFIRYRRRSGYGKKAALNMIGWLIFQLSFLLSEDFDLIQPQNLDSLLPTYVALRILRRKNAPIAYDLADFYADAYLSIWPISKIVAAIERKLVSRVDALILVSPAQTEQVGSKIPEKVLCVYNSPDDIKAVESSNEGDLRILYIGTFERKRYKSLLKFMEISARAGCEFILGGFGEMEESVRLKASEYGNVRFVGRVDRKDISKYYAEADIIFSYFDPKESNNYKVAVPNKFLEALASGKPVIVAEGTFLEEIVREYQIGFPVNLEREEEVINLLNSLSKERSRLVEMGKRARKVYEELFSWDRVMPEYLNLIEDLIERIQTNP